MVIDIGTIVGAVGVVIGIVASLFAKMSNSQRKNAERERDDAKEQAVVEKNKAIIANKINELNLKKAKKDDEINASNVDRTQPLGVWDDKGIRTKTAVPTDQPTDTG